MADSIDFDSVDKRIVSRLLKKGLLNEKDYEKHLKALPDLQEQSATIEATLEPMRITAGGSHPDEE